MFTAKSLFLGTLALSLLGFSAQANLNINNTNNSEDISVIKAFSSGSISLGSHSPLNLALCSASINSDQSRDCSAALQALLKKPNDLFPESLATTAELTPTNQCMLVTIQVAIKQSAIAASSFTGVGFSMHDESTTVEPWASPNNGVFTPKADLHPIGQVVKLKDGSPANIYQFTGSTMCAELNSDGSSFEVATAIFKPYAQFQAGNNITNNWDSVANDYQILGTANGSFDRSADVLDPSSIPASPKVITNMLCGDGVSNENGAAWLRVYSDGTYNLNGDVVVNTSTDQSVLSLHEIDPSTPYGRSLQLNLSSHTGTFDIAAGPGAPRPSHLVINACQIIPTN